MLGQQPAVESLAAALRDALAELVASPIAIPACPHGEILRQRHQTAAESAHSAVLELLGRLGGIDARGPSAGHDSP